MFLRTGFYLASTAGVACGVKMALLQTVLQDSKRGLSPTGAFYLMAPIMFVALAPLQLALEASRLHVYLNSAGSAVASAAGGEAEAASDSQVQPTVLVLSAVLVVSAALALALNISEMMLVHATSALTLNIANTAKFAAIILLSVVLFGTKLSALRVLGMMLCISGVGLFNLHKGRTAKAAAADPLGKEQAELEMQPLLVGEQLSPVKGGDNGEDIEGVSVGATHSSSAGSASPAMSTGSSSSSQQGGSEGELGEHAGAHQEQPTRHDASR